MWTVMLEFSSPHPVPAYFSGIVVAFCAWLHYLLIRGTVWAHVNWDHKKIRIITLNMLEKNRTADIRNDFFFFFYFIYICIYILLAFVCLRVLSWTKMSLVPRCLPLQWLWCRISAVCMIVSKPRDRFSNVRLIFLHLWTAAGYYQLDPGLSVCSMLAMAGGDSTWIHLFISALTITCTYLGAHHLWKELSTVSATSLYLSQHCMKRIQYLSNELLLPSSLLLSAGFKLTSHVAAKIFLEIRGWCGGQEKSEKRKEAPLHGKCQAHCVPINFHRLLYFFDL